MYVGLDVHKDFCQAAFLDDNGLIKDERFENTSSGLEELAKATTNCEVVMEASTATFHVYDAISQTCKVKVAHPRKVRLIAETKIKTDKLDARTLVRLLKAGMIPESYMPSHENRQARLIVRHRASLVSSRTQFKNRIFALLLKEGIKIPFKDKYGKKGMLFMKNLALGEAQRSSLDSLIKMLVTLNKEVSQVEKLIEEKASANEYAKLLETHVGVGWITALAVASEICDIKRFSSHKKLASYFGLVPSVYQSSSINRKGSITKEGKSIIRFLLIQCAWVAVMRSRRFRKKYNKLEKRMLKQKAIVAIARTILVDMYFMLVKNEEYKEPKIERKGGKPVVKFGP